MDFINQNYKSIIVSLTITIVCILVLVTIYNYNMENSLIGEIVKNIVLTILITTTIGTIFNIFTKDNLKSELSNTVKNQLDSKSNFEKFGLEKVYFDSNDYDFTDFIVNSQAITVVTNVGKNWLRMYDSAFKRRFKKSGYKTRFVLLDFKKSGMNDILLKKTDNTFIENSSNKNEYLINQVEMVEELLNNMGSKKHQPEIYKHQLFNPCSVYISENQALVVPYRISKGKYSLPLYIYKKPKQDCKLNCNKCEEQYNKNINEYCRIKIDVENIISYCEESK